MKLKTQLLIVLWFVSIIISFSQKNEDEIKFISEFKKDSLNFDFVKGLCLIDTTFTIESFSTNKNLLNNFIKTLPKKEKTDKKEKKRIKKIYNLVHKKYFKKYEAKAFFNEVFTSGNYNCVSATALYVYVFSELDIPYKIKELPTHVFLIAYPKKYKIHLETTVPGAYGFYMPKESEIKNIVDELVNMKQITKDEVLKKGYSQIYQDYFYGKKSIDKSDLIGMQYYNKSLFEFYDNNLSASLKHIKTH